MKNLVVGAGLSGLTIARLLMDAGEEVVVWEQSKRIGGFITDTLHSIEDARYQYPVGQFVHDHGPHIFHTANREVWDFVNRFAEWDPTTFSSLTKYFDEYYPVPVNLTTFSIAWSERADAVFRMFGTGPVDMERIQTLQKEILFDEARRVPHTFEGVARMRVGDFLFERLFRHYTEAFWGRPCHLIPGRIAERIPVRLNYDPRYHNHLDRWVALPHNGYTDFVERLGYGIPVVFDARPMLSDLGRFKRVFFTGDPSYLVRAKSLPYRGFNIRHELEESVPFQQVIDNTPNQVGRKYCSDNLVPNDLGYPRVVSYMDPISEDLQADHESAAYPLPWNLTTHERMLGQLYELHPSIHFAGRKACYEYLDMDKAIWRAMGAIKRAL